MNKNKLVTSNYGIKKKKKDARRFCRAWKLNYVDINNLVGLISISVGTYYVS